MYIRSKLDYGCFVYGSACTTLLRSLDLVLNEAFRVVIGAFCSTPVDSLRTLTNEMNLEYRRKILSLRYFYKIKGHLDNPASRSLLSLHDRTLFRNRRIALPLAFRVDDLIVKYDIKRNNVKAQLLLSTTQHQDTDVDTYPPINKLRIERDP